MHFCQRFVFPRERIRLFGSLTGPCEGHRNADNMWQGFVVCRNRWFPLQSPFRVPDPSRNLWLWPLIDVLGVMRHNFIWWNTKKGLKVLFCWLMCIVYYHFIFLLCSWLFCSLAFYDIMSFQAACYQVLWNSELVTFWSQAHYWTHEGTDTPLLPSVKYECFLVWLFVSNPCSASASPLVSLDLQRASFTQMAPC